KPDESGFRIMWYSPVPPIDPKTYRLKISGLVERPQSLSLEQLRRYPQVTQSSRMKCVQCWSSRATWGGLRLTHLLETVRPLKTAKAIRIDCADKWYEYMSIEEILSARVLLVLKLRGPALPGRPRPVRARAAPARLLQHPTCGALPHRL